MFERYRLAKLPKGAVTALAVMLLVVTLLPQVSHAQIGAGIESILWTLVNVLFGWMVWLGGMSLDYAINELVVGFGDIYATKGLGFTIDGLWVVVRDIFNLTFIFGLVFIGLRMIFGSDSNTKKMLVSLILAALLVNFSLFITKFVVDFSNIAAVQLVNAFPIDASTKKPSVAGQFASLMGITGMINFSNQAGFDPTKVQNGGGLGYILGTMMLYIITAFVFMGGALLLMIRFVVLNIYIVLSPLMFIGWVFPSAAKYTSEYWSGFLGRAFFAPAYILMLYFAQKILSTFAVTAGGMSLSSMFATNGPQNFINVFPPFVLTSVFLIAALVVAQKMGATGASGVISYGQKLTGRARGMAQGAAGGIVFGGSARAAQTTVGYGARKLADSKAMQAWATKNSAYGGRVALRAANKVADSSFDGRALVGNNSLGASVKGGFDSRVKEKVAADEKFAKLLKETNTKKVTGPDGTVRYEDERAGKLIEQRMSDLRASDEGYKKAESEVSQKRADIAANQPALDAKLVEKQALEDQIKSLKESQLADPYNVKIIEDVSAAEAKLANTNSDLQNLDTNAKTALKALSEAEASQKKIQDKLIKQAETSVRYQNQLAFIETRQKEADFRRNPMTRALTAFGGASAASMGVVGNGLALGALGGTAVSLGAGTVAAIGLQAMGTGDQDSVDNLRKKYGTDGSKMAESEEQLKSAKSIAEQLKKLTDDGSSPTKEAAPGVEAAK